MNWENTIECVPLTDVGLRRANNQDAFASVPTTSAEYWKIRGHLFVVADGMGAHAAGELASKMASDTIPHIYSKLINEPPPEALMHAVQEANRQIHSRGKANLEFEGMGTTCSVLVLLPQGAMVAQVGDSRVYRLRDQTLEQLSFDHSLVWELEAAGKISKDQIAEHIPKNIITRSLGPAHDVNVDLEGPYPVQTGDTFLLCSDGLSGQVSDTELGAILAILDPKEAAHTLVDLANLRGGPDNITLIIIKVGGPAIDQTPQSLPVPIRIAHLKEKGPDPVGWSVMGALLIFVLLMAASQNWMYAGIGLLLLLGAVAYCFRYKLFLDTGPEQTSGVLGRGPYRRYDCPIDAGFAEKMAGILKELKEAATAEDWNIDWHEFNDLSQKAQHATSRRDFREAGRQACRAISFMMNQLRGQKKKKQKKASS